MRKRQKEAILVSFFKERKRLEKLAEYIVHLIRDDPSAPQDSIHTITYRIKDETRLIEKIDGKNKAGGAEPITARTYLTRIGDLLGVRIICLRLSDIQRVEAYLGFLAEEGIFRLVDKPEHKRSFVLPLDPGAEDHERPDLSYSGYSSVHYRIMLGETADADAELMGLQIEFQLRTILEEAWGEIDHKYRYALERSGVELPDHVHSGFYNLSAYLQAAALQAEHLCRQAEACQPARRRGARGKPIAASAAPSPAHDMPPDTPPEAAPALLAELKKTFGFSPAARTRSYIQKRLDGYDQDKPPHMLFRKLLDRNRLREFGTIYRDVLGQEPFADGHKRNLDAINAMNYAMFVEMHGKTVAQEGLRSVLKWRRKDRPAAGKARA